MRSRSKLPAISLSLAAIFAPSLRSPAQDLPAHGGRVVLVLPFENRSGNPSLNWIGESFPDTLDKRLDSSGFLTISRDDRTFAYDHLGLPKDFRPSRATTIQIARQLDANFVIVGSFNVTNNRIATQAQVLSVDELRLSAPVLDSADLPRLFDAQNAIAWKVAKAIDPHFNVAESTFIAAPGAVPLPAFEDYIRGVDATSSQERLQRLRSAVMVVPDYASAQLALGKEQYSQRDYAAAAVTLAKVPPASPLALEAGFYLGLSRFNAANYAGAESAFAFVAARLPLPEVVNDQGVALSRQGRDAVALFQQAATADPSSQDYRFNLAVAYFRRGDTASALSEVAAALKLKPSDNEAIQLEKQLHSVPSGTKLQPGDTAAFSPVERIRRSYSETSYRQAAFQLSQLRATRLSMLPPDKRAEDYIAAGYEALAQSLLPEAESDFQAALQADPGSAAAHAGLAQLRAVSGNPPEARQEATTSLRLQPNAPALLVLARLDLADNKLQIAADEVSQALQLDPHNAAAQAVRQTLQSRGQTVR